MQQQTSWTHTVSLPAEAGSVPRARDFVCAHLLVHHLPALVDDVRLVVSELSTNALQHAHTPFGLTLSREGHLVLLRVQDGSTDLPRLVATNSSSPRGRGLSIVDDLSAGWGVDLAADHTKTVWARFDTGKTMAPEW